MKKMIIVVMAIAVAAITQAANFSWQLTSASDYLEKNAYSFNATDRTAVIAALTAGGTGVADAIAGFAIGGPIQASGRAGKEKFDSKSEYKSDTESSYSTFFVLFDSSIADGNTYSISDNLDVTAYVAKTGEGGKSAFSQTAAATFTTTGQKIGPTQTPEPTSGILLVLGMASLALRRRRT